MIGSIPPQIESHYVLDFENGQYKPVIYFDDFWLLQSKYITLNQTVNQVPLTMIHQFCVCVYVCVTCLLVFFLFLDKGLWILEFS